MRRQSIPAAEDKAGVTTAHSIQHSIRKYHLPLLRLSYAIDHKLNEIHVKLLRGESHENCKQKLKTYYII